MTVTEFYKRIELEMKNLFYNVKSIFSCYLFLVRIYNNITKSL